MKSLRLTHHAEHALGDQLRALSDLLDDHPVILDRIERDFRVPDTATTGACGLSVESVFRCLLLKQILKVSYEKLSFHLSDSPTYRTFARLQEDQFPSRSGLQSTIRHIRPPTCQPDAIQSSYGIRLTRRAIDKVRLTGGNAENAERWIDKVEHFIALLLKVIDQTQRRVYNEEDVPASEKIVSLFEPHTDIIVKGLRDVQFGHKINLATQQDGFIIYCRIEDGNPADAELYMPELNACQADYAQIPSSAVADGCYASQANVNSAKAMGVKRNVFSKPVGLTLVDMGVKKKTFDILRNFRAGVEGNISELKRAFGVGKATWKGHDGFKAFVWSSVLSYNMIRMVRFSSA